jgi:DNA invertase Pin-like site-specific DNA recombinase
VRLVSVQEPWLDTGGPVRDLLLAIFSWIAAQERARLRERTRAGLERARAQGKQIGRPRAKVDVAKAIALLDGGMSFRQVARELGVGASTLHRIVSAHELVSAADQPKEAAALASGEHES